MSVFEKVMITWFILSFVLAVAGAFYGTITEDSASVFFAVPLLLWVITCGVLVIVKFLMFIWGC